jgi:uncharacterized protein
MYLTKRIIFFELDASHALLVNSLSGAVDKVPNELSSKLKELLANETSNINLELEPNIVEYLKHRGYLFDSPRDEYKYLSELFERTNKVTSQKPVKFIICPTYSCNLRCTYCYEGDLGLRNKGIINESQLSAIFSAVDKIRESKPVSNWLFELFGGEPLMKATKKIVQKIFHELRERSEALAIVTNGTNIFEFKELIREYHGILDSIQVTLDGPKAIHNNRRKYANGEGSFDAIVQGVDYLLEEGVQVDLRVNIDNNNIAYLPDLITFMERKNWPFYQNFLCDVAPVTFHTTLVNSDAVLTEDKAVQKILDMFPDMSHLRKAFNFRMFRVLNYISSILEPAREHVTVLPSFHYCEATNLECYVFGPDNNIYACPDSIVNPHYAIGSYYPEFIIDVNKHSYWDRNILNIPKCKECEVATFCGGGCALVPIEFGTGEPACNGARETLFQYVFKNKENILQNGNC